MPNHASCTIIGHLGRDAELKSVGETEKLSFSLATSRRRVSKKTGEIDESTTWWNCAFWGTRAAKVAEYLTKGKAVMVQGEVHLREYEAKGGGKGTSLEVEVRELVLLGDGGKREEPQQAPARRQVPNKVAGSDYHSEPPF